MTDHRTTPPETRGIGSPVAARLAAFTAALSLAAVGFVFAFGSDMPHADEWDVIASTIPDWPPAEWFLGHHNEHRFPLGRLVWTAGMWASGNDFRAGMLLSVAALTGASLLLLSAARLARGRAALADVLIPALLLNPGHAFNLLMGYQVVFTLYVLGVAGCVRAAAGFRPTSVGWAASAVGWTAVAATCGAFGTVFAPVAAVWLAYAGVVGWRAGSRAPAVVLLGGAAAVAAYTAWVVATAPSGDPANFRRAGRDILAAAAGYYGIGLGSWADTASSTRRAVAAVIGCACYLAATALLIRAILFRPAVRPFALACWLALVGQAVAAVAIAVSRGAGLQDRYVSPGAVGLAVCWLAITALPRRIPRALTAVAMVAAVALLAANGRDGWATGTRLRAAARRIEADIGSRVPLSLVAGRHGGSPMVVVGERMADRLKLLRAARVGIFADVADDPPFGVLPIPLAPFELKARHPPYPTIPLSPPGRRVIALRAIGEQTHFRPDQRLILRWRGANGEDRTADAWAPAVPSRMAACFLVDDVPTEVRLEPAGPLPGLTVERLEWLVRDDAR